MPELQHPICTIVHDPWQTRSENGGRKNTHDKEMRTPTLLSNHYTITMIQIRLPSKILKEKDCNLTYFEAILFLVLYRITSEKEVTALARPVIWLVPLTINSPPSLHILQYGWSVCPLLWRDKTVEGVVLVDLSLSRCCLTDHSILSRVTFWFQSQTCVLLFLVQIDCDCIRRIVVRGVLESNPWVLLQGDGLRIYQSALMTKTSSSLNNTYRQDKHSNIIRQNLVVQF